MLIAIKLLHTFIWAVFAGGILALPWLAHSRRFRWAVWISIVIWIECVVVIANGWRCPLTDWAAQYTSDRAANFDIYLPVWLAATNQKIFSTQFVLGEIYLAYCWVREVNRQKVMQKANGAD